MLNSKVVKGPSFLRPQTDPETNAMVATLIPDDVDDEDNEDDIDDVGDVDDVDDVDVAKCVSTNHFKGDARQLFSD